MTALSYLVISQLWGIPASERQFNLSFSVIGGPPQDVSYRNETKLLIGDYNVIRENCTLSTGTVKGRSITEVGSHNLIWPIVMLLMTVN